MNPSKLWQSSSNNILSYYFGFILYHCIYGCVFCVLRFNFVQLSILIFMYTYRIYVFLYLCIFRALFHCVFLCIFCV
jgi:hypothetical protein